jgi:hypothetical protein
LGRSVTGNNNNNNNINITKETLWIIIVLEKSFQLGRHFPSMMGHENSLFLKKRTATVH